MHSSRKPNPVIFRMSLITIYAFSRDTKCSYSENTDFTYFPFSISKLIVFSDKNRVYCICKSSAGSKCSGNFSEVLAFRVRVTELGLITLNHWARKQQNYRLTSGKLTISRPLQPCFLLQVPSWRWLVILKWKETQNEMGTDVAPIEMMCSVFYMMFFTPTWQHPARTVQD